MTRPQANEAATYYSRYIDLITDEDIVSRLKSQLGETTSFLSKISDEQSLNTYAPGKWTIRQVLNHVNDAERVFASRAFWFARGLPDALPGFDQDVCVESAGANDVSWSDLTNEFSNVRQSTISLFENLPAQTWMRTGVASDNPFTVNALGYIIAGHVSHHCNVIQERYL
jgi:DinB superfamily